MKPEELADGLRFLLDRATGLPGKLVSALLVANPTAGGFTRPSYSKLRHAELLALMDEAAEMPSREVPVRLELGLTRKPAHAAEIARDFFASARAEGLREGEFRLVMPAGGDGTSFEVISALMELPLEERRRYAVLRLPFGTGNDGSDGRELHTCLGRLLGPCALARRTAVLVTPAAAGGKRPIWSFNIASFGADAFIAHMTNEFKAFFPGDFYKICVDIASVFYDLAWPSSPLRLKAFSSSGEKVRDFTRRMLLLAIGASGHRQYGSNKAILPDDNNVCALSQMSLLRKLAVKGPLQVGGHRAFPEADLFGASRIELEYHDRVLFQADGEITRFDERDFPMVVELVEDSYSCLCPTMPTPPR
jgi:diacylglycerol kinase family enzyme